MGMVAEKPALVYLREEISELITLVATDKGAFLYYSDAERRHWDVNGPHFLGSVIHHLVLDHRNNKTLMASVNSRISGANIYCSKDFGKTWKPASKPPAFSKGKRDINHTFFLAPGHDSEAKVWYAGTSPQGLFRSEDDGDTWKSVDGFNNAAEWKKWTAASPDGYPKIPKLHSILIDPNDKNNMTIGMSYGGVFVTADQGDSWQPLNKGVKSDFLNGSPEFGHDPHSVIFHPFKPERLFQQNHCGIYRLDRPKKKWERVGDNMPGDIGDIGFPIAIHPGEPDTIWVFPIDGNEAWSRVSPEGQPALYCSQDGGDTWFRQDIGLPMRNAWFTVLRQGLTTDCHEDVGVYFGTTSGSLWMSDNEGNSWRQIAVHLPRILAVETGAILKKG